MKRVILLLLFPIGMNAQTLKNSGFEKIPSHKDSIASNWKIRISDPSGKETAVFPKSIIAMLDKENVHTGKRSLKMSVGDSNNFVMTAAQEIPVEFSGAKSVRIIAWVKTKDCKKGAGFNCTQFNATGKQIAYTSSRQQERLITNTSGWTKSEILVLLRPEVKTIEIRCLLYSAGTAWFDDVSVEPVSKNKQPAAPPVLAFVDMIMKTVKANSLYTDSINWNSFAADVKELQAGMQTYGEARLAGNYILSELKRHGDNHSSIMSPAMVKEFGANDIMGRGRKVEGEYLADGVGYISMPGFGSMNDSISKAFATYAQDVIKKIDSEHNICSWIIDLRNDNGGSCNPMIAGLGPILGEGVFNKYTENNGHKIEGFYNNGEVYESDNGVRSPEYIKVGVPYRLKHHNAPVAILIGANCGSSGEAAAAAFIDRPNTKLFGQPTGGFTRGNSDYTLPDGSMLFLSSGVQTDRNGKKYWDRIYPDVTVTQPENSKRDETREHAKAWLLSMAACK